MLGVLLMALTGWWLGNRDRSHITPKTVADSPAPTVNASPQASSPAITQTHARIAMPAAARMGPFAPPVPDTLSGAPADPLPPEEIALQPTVTPLAPAPPRKVDHQPTATTQQPQAWARHALASPANPGNLPLIAIVIDDLGIAPARATAALALPAPMTMAVLPYARDAAQVARNARALGHEVLVHLPMEAANGQDPGQHALLAQQTPEEFVKNVRWNLARLEGYVGINNHMGSGLTQNSAAMAMLMAQLKQRGLLFLDSRTGPHTVGASTARATGVTTLERDIFLDNVITPEAIRAQLQKAEEIALRNGHAIAIGHPHPATIAALAQWAADIEARGFRLAPLTMITRTGAATKRVVALPPAGN